MSGGFRSIIVYRASDRAFFVYGSPKSARDNISTDELQAFRLLAREMLNYNMEQLAEAVRAEVLREVRCNE
jgi:hypothetical protein